MQARPRTQTGFPRGKGDTVDVSEEPAQSCPFGGCHQHQREDLWMPEGAGAKEKTTLALIPSVITSYPQGSYALRCPHRESLDYTSRVCGEEVGCGCILSKAPTFQLTSNPAL